MALAFSGLRFWSMWNSQVHPTGVVVAFTVLACAASQLEAQSKKGGVVELGTFGSFTKYDNTSVGAGQELGAGGRLGLFFNRVLSFEAGGDYTETSLTGTGDRLTVTRLTGSILANSRAGAYLGAGYERLVYRSARKDEQSGFHLLIGQRLSMGGRAALRIQGHASYIPSSNLGDGTNAINFGASLGISVFTFGGPPRDTDMDGIANKGDNCPGTPLGVVVDLQGCPVDTDGDGVFDGPDQCEATPDGALVDDVGCPTDTDQDEVFDGIDVCPNTPVGAAVDENGCPTDEDSDGVFDGIDQCPATPAGATVDPTGCPSDEDADGVFDGIDQCPGTPAGVAVAETGCPVDDDGDGVNNELDQCPNTPPGTEVDERGCRLFRDSDGDGVDDSQDRCPGTPLGRPVDAIGCPILFVVEEGVERPLVLKGVNFRTNSAELTPESFEALDQVAASLLAHADVRVEISGHTDATGSRRRNNELSIQRALSVKEYLVQKGIDPDRMEAKGYGPDRPIATNATRDGRSQNRRVELSRLEEP